MLTELSLRNFKSWRGEGNGPINVPLSPITGFFGSNSSGKTSLLQALLLLKQTAASTDRGQVLNFGGTGSLVDLGDFRTVVSGHDRSNPLQIGMAWSLGAPLEIKDPVVGDQLVLQSDRLRFMTRTTDPSGRTAATDGGSAPRLRVEEMAYTVGGATFAMRLRDRRPKGEYDLSAMDSSLRFVRTQGRAWPLPPPLKCYGFPDEVRAYFQNAGFLSDLELELERKLKNTYYLGPLRAYPERQYPWGGGEPDDMGRAGEQAINAILAARERGRWISRGRGHKRATLEDYAARWLRNLGLIDSFRVEEIADGGHLYRVLVRKTANAAEVLVTDVGFGVSQILPVLILCFYVPEGSTVILEQPEIHLHPAVQAGLADVLIDAWKTRRVQVLVESHSEHLLRRLQRRVAEESLSVDEARLYFCRAEGGQSVLTPLRMDRFGHIENWPKDFFGDEFGEMAAITGAAQQRKRRLG